MVRTPPGVKDGQNENSIAAAVLAIEDDMLGVPVRADASPDSRRPARPVRGFSARSWKASRS
jgi:hypothetical protein